MDKIRTFILLLSIKVAYSFELNSTYNNNTGLVYNGQKYNPIEHPYVVTIRIYSDPRTIKMICTGTLIRPLYVLTAAHCVHGTEARYVVVFAGSSKDNKDYRRASEVNVHNRYRDDPETITGDLCLVTLPRPFLNVKKYLNIGGNSKEFANLNPVKCVCIGFGSINDRNHLGQEGVMMTTDVRHGKTACRDSFLTRRTWEEYLCAVTPMTSMVCQGDSGGPLICNGKLYGVCSFYYNYTTPDGQKMITKCGGPTMQTVHVFLRFHLEWINSILPPVKKKKKKNSGNMLKAHLILHTIIALLMNSVD